jgi:hypothetical protein
MASRGIGKATCQRPVGGAGTQALRFVQYLDLDASTDAILLTYEP